MTVRAAFDIHRLQVPAIASFRQKFFNPAQEKRIVLFQSFSLDALRRWRDCRVLFLLLLSFVLFYSVLLPGFDFSLFSASVLLGSRHPSNAS